VFQGEVNCETDMAAGSGRVKLRKEDDDGDD